MAKTVVDVTDAADNLETGLWQEQEYWGNFQSFWGPVDWKHGT